MVGERENGKGGLKGRDLSVGNHVYLSASNGTSLYRGYYLYTLTSPFVALQSSLLQPTEQDYEEEMLYFVLVHTFERAGLEAILYLKQECKSTNILTLPREGLNT